MSGLTKRERAAVEAVARHFSATWTGGSGAAAARLTIAGRQIAVETATLRLPGAGEAAIQRLRLRFDKVVLRLLHDLETALRELAPSGATVIVTVTAPIRLPAKTVDALRELIRSGLRGRSKVAAVGATINGNGVRMRVLKGDPGRDSTLIGFVHNPDPDCGALLDAAQFLFERVSPEADRRHAARAGDERWLVVANGAGGSAGIATYRHICARITMPADLKAILMVCENGRVEMLTGHQS